MTTIYCPIDAETVGLVRDLSKSLVGDAKLLADALVSRYEDAIADLEKHAEEIEIAREKYALPSDNDLEIDDQPAVSVAENGVWVNAWVWVPDEDAEDAEV